MKKVKTINTLKELDYNKNILNANYETTNCDVNRITKRDSRMS